MSWEKPQPQNAGWNNPVVKTPAQIAAATVPADPYAGWTNDQLLVAWQVAKTALDAAKANELALREATTKRLFPAPKKGTNTVELGHGYKAKMVHKVNYNFVKNTEGKTDVKAIEAAQDKIEHCGNIGAALADRLIDWKPEFSLSEYNKLDLDNDDEKAIKLILDEVLVATDATPAFEIVEPKAK